jgi:hypothetical protein
MPPALPHISHFPISWQSMRPISQGHLVKHFPNLLHAPAFGIHIHQATPHKPLWMIRSWACLPSSSASTLAQAFSTPTKAPQSGCTPFCCIYLNSSNASHPCPHFTYPNIMAVQQTTLCDGTLVNALQAYSMREHLAYMLMRLQSHNQFQWPFHEHAWPLKVLVS